MRNRIIAFGILLASLVASAPVAHAGGFVWLSGLRRTPPTMRNEVARLDAAVTRVDALLLAADAGEGSNEGGPDGWPLDAGIEDLDAALTDLLDVVEEEVVDLPVEDQVLVLEYLFDVDDALYALESHPLVNLGGAGVGIRDRLIVIIDDLNTDI